MGQRGHQDRRRPHRGARRVARATVDHHRHGTPILIRADAADCTPGFLAHIRSRRDAAVICEFSVGWAIKDKERAAITAIPKRVWADAIDADGGHRDGAGLAEIIGALPPGPWPATRQGRR